MPVNHKSFEQSACYAGEKPGIGVYLCNQCHFAIVVVKDNYMLPHCPCCEHDRYAVSPQVDIEEEKIVA